MSVVSYNEFILETNGKLQHFAVTNITDPTTKIIPEISTDTRTIKFRDAFLALKGELFDGNDFVTAALDKGASLLILDFAMEEKITKLLAEYGNENFDVILVPDTLKAYGILARLHRQHFNIKTLALTGSCGKTTLKQMIYAILKRKHETLVTIGNYNNEIGVPRTLLNLNSNYDYAVIEMGARVDGDIDYLCSIAKPDIAVVNNVAPVHLETFLTMDNIAKQKGAIYKYLPADGTAIINADDVYAPYWLSLLTTQNIITFGFGNADISCSYIAMHQGKTVFELITDLGNVTIEMPLVGKHNVNNALAAVAFARGLGIGLKTIKEGLANVQAETRRLQYMLGVNNSSIIDDSYNANPYSTRFALDILKEHKGRKIFVFGDMFELGSDTIEYHKQIGAYAKDIGIDLMLTIGNLAGYALEESNLPGKHFSSKQELAENLVAILETDCLVLIKGSNGMGLDAITKVLTMDKVNN